MAVGSRARACAIVWVWFAGIGCGPSAGTPSGQGGEAGGSESAAQGEAEADPDYRRMCEQYDFVCENWGCADSSIEGLVDGECYKHCETDEPGTIDDECDEPERPYCSEIPDSDFGDYDCNADATVCLATPVDWC
jgi:hypothetical protein